MKREDETNENNKTNEPSRGFMTSCSLHRLTFCLVLLAMLAAPAQSQSSGDAKSRALPPSRAELLPISAPDLSRLEADVREQLLSLQNALAVTLKDTTATDLKLGEAYGLLGQVYQAYALRAPAQQCYLNAQQLAPQDFRWVYLLGQLAQQEGRAEEAIRYYQSVRSLRPDYLPAPVHLGNLYLQQHRPTEADASFRAALAINANCTAARYGLGQLALSSRDYAAAVKHFEQTLAEALEANRIHYALAMAYRGLGKIEQAQAHLQQQGTVGVRVTDPLIDGLPALIRGERLHLLRGQLAFDARRLAEAADEFRKAFAANPNSIQARVNLGSVLAQMGEGKQAVEQYQEALRINPNHAAAHYNLGFLLVKQHRHEQAITHLQAALQANANDVDARFLLAQALLKSARPAEALTEFARVVAAAPDNEEALLEQVQLLLRGKQYSQALASLEQGHARFPQKGQTAALLAWLLAANPQAGLRDGARALTLARLVYQATSLVNHGAIVALALAELGRCREAAAWQRQMIVVAERDRQSELVGKLRAELPRYEQAPPCRPPAEPVVADPPLRPQQKP